MSTELPLSPPPAPSSVQVSGKPGVILWYKLYLGLLALLFLLCAGFGVFFYLVDFEQPSEDDLVIKVMGGIYVGMGLLLLIPCLVGFFLPQRKGAWIYHLVMICIGMTGCTIVFSVPLLLFWLKPEVKAWYGFEEPRTAR